MPPDKGSTMPCENTSSKLPMIKTSIKTHIKYLRNMFLLMCFLQNREIDKNNDEITAEQTETELQLVHKSLQGH